MLARAGEKYLAAFEAMSGLGGGQESGDAVGGGLAGAAASSSRYRSASREPMNNSSMNYRQQCWLLHHRLKVME